MSLLLSICFIFESLNDKLFPFNNDDTLIAINMLLIINLYFTIELKFVLILPILNGENSGLTEIIIPIFGYSKSGIKNNSILSKSLISCFWRYSNFTCIDFNIFFISNKKKISLSKSEFASCIFAFILNDNKLYIIFLSKIIGPLFSFKSYLINRFNPWLFL